MLFITHEGDQGTSMAAEAANSPDIVWLLGCRSRLWMSWRRISAVGERPETQRSPAALGERWHPHDRSYELLVKKIDKTREADSLRVVRWLRPFQGRAQRRSMWRWFLQITGLIPARTYTKRTNTWWLKDTLATMISGDATNGRGSWEKIPQCQTRVRIWHVYSTMRLCFTSCYHLFPELSWPVSSDISDIKNLNTLRGLLYMVWSALQVMWSVLAPHEQINKTRQGEFC